MGVYACKNIFGTLAYKIEEKETQPGLSSDICPAKEGAAAQKRKNFIGVLELKMNNTQPV